MTDPRQDQPSMPDIATWLDVLATVFPPTMLDELGTEERAALLDLARIAAHQSHRSAAPITTYLAGLQVAAHPPAERLAVLQALARALDLP